MSNNRIRLKEPEFSALYDQFPEFDILRFDFYDRNTSGRLADALQRDHTLHRLKIKQRVLRIAAQCLGSDNADSVHRTALKLESAGLQSAGSIASIPQHRFLQQYGSQL